MVSIANDRIEKTAHRIFGNAKYHPNISAITTYKRRDEAIAIFPVLRSGLIKEGF